MLENKKLLSIIVPSYNMEAYLPKCLGSLIIDNKELLQKLDIIVVNDGSKDRTSEIAHEFEAKYPGVFRVIDKANGHYGSCVNAGLTVAEGTYVKVLDADDYVVTEAFNTFVLKLQNCVLHQKDVIDLVISNWQIVNGDGNVTKRSNFNITHDKVFTLEEIGEDFEGFVGLHAITYRTELLKKMGYRQTEGCAYTDTEWFLIPMIRVEKVFFIEDVVACYLLGREGQSMQKEVFLKDFPVLVQLTRKIVKRFDDLCNSSKPTSIRYFKSRFGLHLHYVYTIGIFNRYSNIIQVLDEDLLNFSKEMYNKLGESVYHSRMFNFRHIKEWRRKYSCRTLRLILLNLYCRLNNVRHWIMDSICK
jgi:glycosyltransferase involved in cell wall biosynthesis